VSGMDIVPSFLPDPEDGEAVVPGEFNFGDFINKNVPLPPPTTERLITPMNPEGRAPRDGMGFGENVSGGFRSGTLAGATVEASELETVRSPTKRKRTVLGDSSFRSALRNGGVPDPADADTVQRNRVDDAEDAFYGQVAFDNSKANLSVSSAAGAVVGSLASPESFGGVAGLLVRQFPALALRPILTAGIDAAITNTVTDPLVQATRMASGAQAEYDPMQTAVAPIIGFTIGAGGRALMDLPSVVRERQAAAVGVEPDTLRAAEAPAVDAPPVEPGADPVISRAVDEALAVDADAVATPAKRIVAQGADEADVVKKQWRTESPYDDADAMMQAAPANQKSLGEAGERIAAEVGVTFKNPGVKGAARFLEKAAEKRPGEITDLVRAGFDLRSPNQADEIVTRLSRDFDLIDEGWFVTDAGYFDRKVYVRFDDGMIGELQFWEPSLLKAKNDAGHDLYVKWRSAPKDSPNAKALEQAMRDVYRPVLEALPDDWRAAVTSQDSGSGGSVGNLARNAASVSERASIEGSAPLRETQAPSLRTQAEPASKMTGSPSQEPNLKGISDTSAPNIDTPAPSGKTLSVVRGEDGRISGIDLEASGLEMATADDGRVLFRRRGAQPAPAAPPNQVQAGRPVADQGTPVAPPQPSTRVQRLEDMSRAFVQSFEGLAREGRVKPGALGQFDKATGITRVKSVADLDTVAHEVGHDFHLTRAKKDVDALVKTNKLELQPLGAGDKTGNQEAFAELFRLYAVNRNYAAQNYPRATAALEALLRSKFPQQADALDAMRVQLDAMFRAPSGEIVTADTIQSAPPNFGDRFREAIKADRDPSGRSIYSAFDALYTATVDRTHPVWKAVENLAAIAKRNGKNVDIKPVDDAYVLARMLPGSHGAAGIMLEHGVIPANAVDPQGPSLAGAIEKALGQKWGDEAFADFGGYLVARRMVAEYTRFFNGEIPNPPGKFSLADYQRAVADIEAANPQFRDAAQDVYAFLTNHLKRAYDKGLFSKEYLDASLKRVDYVPFVRDMADFADDAADVGGGRPAGLRFSLMKAFKGSQRSVQNPLESIFKKVHDLEYAIALNDTVSSLARLADSAGPGSGAIAEAVPSNQLKGQKVDVIEALKAAGKSSGVDDADLKSLIIQAEDVLQDSTWATLFRQQEISPGKEPIVFYWVNGERRALRLADGRFGTELFHALNAMPDLEKNWFVSVLQVSQQILRTGVTRAPDFLLVNFIRDQLTAAATSGRKYIPFVSAAKGVVDAIRKTADAQAYAARGGMAAGAISDAIDQSNFGRNVQALEKAGVIKNAKAGDYLGAGKALFRQSIKALELSEAGTRMGLYKSYFAQAKDMGFDDLNASTYAAFRATDYVDFRKAGASMGLLRRWVPFLNAAIQGTDRELRALADLPVLEAKRGRGEVLTPRELDRLKDARVAWVRVTSMGAILGGGIALMNADEEEYQTAPKFTKDTNFLIKVNDTWLAIPKPFGATSAVVNAFEYGTDAAIRQDPSLIGPWMEAAGKGFTPPTTNPLVSLAYDMPANYNRFQNRPIVPYYLQGVKPSEQYTAGTSELSKLIGATTGWSPIKVEYAISQMGGSMALNLLRTSDLAMGRDAPEKQVYDWPIARRFVKNLARGNQATTEFFNLVGDKNGSYEQSENAYRVKIRNGERAAAATYLRGLPEDERVWAVLQSQGFDATEKRLHPMQNAKDRTAVASGVLSQLNFNNLIREADVDRQNTIISRRDAIPLALDKSTRSKLIEGLQELQMTTARNAMVAIGAKGTKGLDIVNPQPILDRLKAISPEAFAEYEERLKSKKVYDFADTVKAWPETKARLLRDGEDADLSDLVPAGMRTKRRKSRAQ
jgi:hypothetical protein